MQIKMVLLAAFVGLAGCAPRTASPGATLWAGLYSYQEEMRTLEARPERWPDRQRLAESIKSTYVATFGGSEEFNRLVNLDLRRREFLITLRAGGLKADREKEMQQELITMNRQIEALGPTIKRQFANSQLSAQDPSQAIESVATIGLMNLAIDAFSPVTAKSDTVAPATEVGPYVVMGQGLFSEVRTPEGRIFRCATTLVPEAGASIKCEPAF